MGGDIAGAADQHLRTIAHQDDGDGVPFPCGLHDLAGFLESPLKPRVLAVPHAERGVDRHDHADLLSSDQTLGRIHDGPQQSERQEGEREAAQEKDEVILKFYLPRADDQGATQQLHSGPVGFLAVLPVEEVDDDRDGDAGQTKCAPKGK